ncbi:hypothetical protein QA601_11705 [Chitinispirillales bacterium ANBcel5]|uniref:hypothetical protein n=1 Tax=Cellulosispirillum alkaliphilum TaxID=3039283 RepID=UPI002A52498F|nr:hypothetical protein [Chitinispirillales bacterium ANBcel5]
MRKRSFLMWTTFLIAYVILTGGCQQVTGIEGEGMVAVAYSNGTPASGIKVRVIDAKNWQKRSANSETPVVYEIRTDENGYYKHPRRFSHGYNLELSGENEGFFWPDAQISVDKDVIPITLKEYSTISGKITSEYYGVDTVMLRGTSYKAAINDKDSFDLNFIAPGNYQMYSSVVSIDSLRYVTDIEVQPGENITDLELNVVPYVYFYRFGNSQNTLLYSQSVNNECWFTYYGGIESWVYNVVNDHAIDGLGYMKTRFGFGESSDSHLGIGARFLAESNVDLSEVDSLLLRIKGEGVLRFNIESKLIEEEQQTERVSHYGAAIELTSEWQVISILTDNLSIEVHTDYSWYEASKDIEQITIEAEKRDNPEFDTLTFMIDYISLHGVTMEGIRGF